MTAIDATEVRALLERTGRLHTKDPDDVGHISAFWRKTITELCDTIDAFTQPPVGDEALRETEELLVRVQVALLGALPAERLVCAHWLVEQAVPRMQSLNNQMSPRWLAVAEAFLSGDERPSRTSNSTGETHT